MKKKCSTFLIVLCVVWQIPALHAQGVMLTGRTLKSAPHPLAAYRLSVGCQETTCLVFPYGIRAFGLGSGWLTAQKAPGTDNLLELKATRKDFPATSLHVVTADGAFYGFRVGYQEHPGVLNLSFAPGSPAVLFRGVPANQALFDSVATRLKGSKPFLHIHRWYGARKIALDAACYTGKLLYIRITIRNFLPVDFRPAEVRFLIRDRKSTRRTAMHQLALGPLYHTGLKTIAYEGSASYVFAFRPFTLSRNRRLVIKMRPDDGGETLLLTAGPRVFRHPALLRLH